MSEELYYRGSCTYETAVQNQLARIRNSNESLRYSIQDMEYGIRSDIRQSTYAIVASQEMLASTFSHGFNSVNNTLSIVFDRMSMKMAEIANAINAMTEEVCSRLDEIHDIVNNPLLTQSRELYRRALTNFEKGYYEEALEDIKSAVEKNKTDFISWHLLGQIYLFGAGKFSNVINIDEAENAFINAAKYIDADIGQSEEADNLASEIYYYLGYTRLVKSNDMLVEGKADESEKKLIEAEVASGRAYKISKENILAGYEQAKELHFLGHDDKAINILKEIIKAEPTFSLKASNDKNFESMWDKIDALIETLRDEVALQIQKIFSAYGENIKSNIESLKKKYDNLDIPSKYEFENFLPNFDTSLLDRNVFLSKCDKSFSDFEQKHSNVKKLDYLSTLKKCKQLTEMKDQEKKKLLNLYCNPIKSIITSIEEASSALKRKKAEIKDAKEAEIVNRRKKTITIIGITVGIIVGIIVGKLLFHLLQYNSEAQDYITGSFALIGAVLGYFIGGFWGVIGGLIILGLIGMGLGNLFTISLFVLPLFGSIPISVGSILLSVLFAVGFAFIGNKILNK